MHFHHPLHPGRLVRLAYCLNLHPAEDLEGVLAGMRSISVPLALRLGRGTPEEPFGVGPWLAAPVALRLASPEGEDELLECADFLAEYGLDAFTFNAFPYGGFHEPGLKAGVFEPTWRDPKRLAYTMAVARVAVALRTAKGVSGPSRGAADGHISISTHTGMFAPDGASRTDVDACAQNLVHACCALRRLEEESGQRVILSLEPEPRANAGNTEELERFITRIRELAPAVVERESPGADPDEIVTHTLGTCLDACHAAVEFEEPQDAFLRVTAEGRPLGKIQFSSALRLPNPLADSLGRSALFEMDEPVYLHQATGRGPGGLLRAVDLPELFTHSALKDPDWCACDEWRCHFHVPVDADSMARFGERTGGLATTRSVADELLAVALADPDRWGSDELHVEIETYTWHLLAAKSDSSGDPVDGLAAEYASVLAQLEYAGWKTTVDDVPAR